MRRKWCSVVMIAALAVCLAGCGAREQQRDSAEEKNQVDAVVRNAGMTSEEQQRLELKADIEPGVVLTEHCLYYFDDENIIQTDHAGNELSRVPLEDDETFAGLLCGSGQRIVYAREYTSDYDVEQIDLYQVPVLQTDDGESVNWDQKQKLVSCRYDPVLYPDVFLQEPYLVYRLDDYTIVRHHLETGDEEKMDLSMDQLAVENNADFDGCLYFRGIPTEDKWEDMGALYRLDIANWKLEKLYEMEDREEYISHIWIEGSFAYMNISKDEDGYVFSRLECFDLEQKKRVGQLSAQDIFGFLEQEKICTWAQDAEIDCSGLSVYAGKAYLTVSGYDYDVESGKEKSRDILLCCTEKNLSNLENEREMTDWYDTHSKDEGHCNTLDGYGEFYYFEVIDEEEDEFQRMCYHLDTKQMEELGHNELIWQGYERSSFY